MIANRFQSWNQQDLVSKCRGKGRTRGNCVCENLDDWEVVPPLQLEDTGKDAQLAEIMLNWIWVVLSLRS